MYTGEDGNRNVTVYDLSGEVLYTRKIPDEYNSFAFTDVGMIVHGNKKFMLLNEKGNEIVSGEFDADISDIIHVDGKEYLFISPDKIYKVKFK